MAIADGGNDALPDSGLPWSPPISLQVADAITRERVEADRDYRTGPAQQFGIAVPPPVLPESARGERVTSAARWAHHSPRHREAVRSRDH
jgi:hypothetical protein